MTILPNLAQENEALKLKLADMQAMLALASKPKAITLKVSEKGALSIMEGRHKTADEIRSSRRGQEG